MGLSVSYALIDYDYTSGSGGSEFTFDARLGGPFLGATIRF